MLPSDIETKAALRHLSVPADGSRKGLSRRRFLQAAALGTGGLLAGPGLGFGGILPGWEEHLAAADPLGPADGVLVVLLMAGGNDALNTVVPFGQPSYYTKRGSLAYQPIGTLPLAPGLGLNPNLVKLEARFAAGKVAIVQGIGVVDQVSFSHFESMAAWMQGSAGGGTPNSGWLGRWLDGAPPTNPFAAVSIDSSVPLHLIGETRKAIALNADSAPFGGTPDPGWDLVYEAFSNFAAQPSGLGSWGDAVAGTGSQLIQTAAQAKPLYSPTLPAGPLVDKLTLAARLINADLGARVIGVTYGDFDSHKNQPNMHPNRMRELDAGVEAFFTTLGAGFQGRTSMMVFSEFGRYPVRNDSNGVDHGWSGNAFVIGDRVAGGLKGQTLDTAVTETNGHIRPTMDFRSMYASLLTDWLAADATQILGGSFSPVPLFSSAPG